MEIVELGRPYFNLGNKRGLNFLTVKLGPVDALEPGVVLQVLE
jgi:hypothetical protein